jgi:hypothetical protein
MLRNYKVYQITNNDTYEYFFTSNTLSKYIYGLKHNKASSKIKELLHTNSFSIMEMSAYENVDRNFMTNELTYFYRNHEDIKRIHNNEFIDKTHKNIRLLNSSNNEIKLDKITNLDNREYGKVKEDIIFKHLNNTIFNNELTQFKNRFATYDFFYSPIYYMVEFKSLRHSKNKYTNAVMTTNKLIYDRVIFVYEYTENDNTSNYFYHIYEPNRYYNTRYIKPRNRINLLEIIDIPIRELIPLDNLKSFIETQTNNDVDNETKQKFTDIVFLDKFAK